MQDTPDHHTPPAAPLSFARRGGRIFGWYVMANVAVFALLALHVFMDPFGVLFFLSFIGPSALAFVIILVWLDTARPGRSGAVLALLLAGAAGVAWLHLVVLAQALSAV